MNELIRYQLLENGIHEVTFLEKTRLSIDEFYQTLQIINDTSSTNQVVRLLVDLSMPGTIPIQYMFQESQSWRNRNPKTVPIRVLVLHPVRGILPVARILVNSIVQARVGLAKLRLESVTNRDEAIRWLLQDTP